MGIWNPTEAPIRATVWVNELRLSRAVQDAGYAGYVDLNLEAPSLLRTSISYSGSGPFFRQLSGDPNYQDDATLSVFTTLELGRVAPEDWGISIPVTVTHTDLTQDPTFLSQSDVRTDRLPGLRKSGLSETRFEVGLRKTTPLGNRLLDPIVTGLSLRAGYSRSRISTTTLVSKGSGMDARAEFSSEVESRDLPLFPGFARSVVRVLLPASAEERVLGARFRWSPERIRFGTLYTNREREAFRYEQILLLPQDSLVTPTLSPREALETTAQVSFRPLDPLTAELTFFSVRDLLSPGDAIQDPLVHPLLEEERWGLGSMDLGWETNRNLSTRIGFRPELSSWLSTDFSVTTVYASDRNPALLERAVLGTDTLL
ncbi:hypothetical protein ACFL0I_05330, partial [Gemmatimonadota bacterium]